jgi:hypothetical protein
VWEAALLSTGRLECSRIESRAADGGVGSVTPAIRSRRHDVE